MAINIHFIKKILILINILIATNFVLAQENDFESPERGFTSWLPAQNWEQALLSGNGEMGALVFGNPHEETIIMSHALLYLPQERSEKLIDQASHLKEIQQLIREGRYEDATKIPVKLREEEGYSDQRDPFIPAFDIRITQQEGNIDKYIRSTNFETGETRVEWTDSNGSFKRRLFVSRADSVAVLYITSDHPINCSIRFEHRPVEWNQWEFVSEYVGEMTASAANEWLTYRSNFKKKYNGSLEGYEGVGRLQLSGGTVTANNNQLQIKDGKNVMLLVKIQPSYDYEHSQIPEIKQQLNRITADYSHLLKRHVAIHGKIFSRMKLDLNSSKEEQSLHSEEILLKAKEKNVPLALIEKVFDAGRYNILSSTGINPPNLQGIWSGTWSAPWSSGFTHDGNLPSAMSSVLSGNMPELMKAYAGYLKRYEPDFTNNAEQLFGIRGINLPGHTTTSGWPTDFNQRWCLTLWTGGAGWAADILYDYYRYTADTSYLKNMAYPWMKKSAWFYEDFLEEGNNGEWVFNPSYSPENNPANSSSQIAMNATMDIMIARQVLQNCIKAGNVVGEKKEQLTIWHNMLKKMPEYEINKDSVLKEWLWPGLEDNYRHRHSSQLYSLFNGRDPLILGNPVLKEGATRLIKKKLDFRRDEDGGEMAFGLVQLGLSAAHLGNADQAYEAVRWLASRYWSTGMASYHNVGGLLNTDISGGLPAVIIEMLVYSEKGKIQLLPALPKEWPTGSIKGALLRNEIEMKNLTWSKQHISLQLVSKTNQRVNIIYPNKGGHKSKTVHLIKDKIADVNFTL